MKISMIMAIGTNNELGLENKLLWHIPEDLKNFKKITDGHHVLMGKNTFLSIFEYLGKPLPNRTSIVLSSENYENVINVRTIEEGINKAIEAGEKELFIIGGASIYNKYYNMVDKIYLSKITYSGLADCFFEGNFNSFKEISSTEYENWTFKELVKK